MNAKWLVLMLAAGCVAPIDDADDESVTEEELLNCPDNDPDCTPYPETPPRRPDLVPVVLAQSDGHCWWDGYSLRLAVKNTGQATAVATQVKLEFTSNYFGRWYAVPSLAPGATYNFAVYDLRLDENCYAGGCRAKLTADWNGALTESNETNNVASRGCYFHF